MYQPKQAACGNPKAGIGPPLACADRRAEYVGILAVVVAELKLVDVERKVFLTDLMERAHDPALNQRPEAFNCLRMDRAVNVFACAVVNEAMREMLVDVVVARMFVRGYQAHL